MCHRTNLFGLHSLSRRGCLFDHSFSDSRLRGKSTYFEDSMSRVKCKFILSRLKIFWREIRALSWWGEKLRSKWFPAELAGPSLTYIKIIYVCMYLHQFWAAGQGLGRSPRPEGTPLLKDGRGFSVSQGGGRGRWIASLADPVPAL